MYHHSGLTQDIDVIGVVKVTSAVSEILTKQTGRQVRIMWFLGSYQC